MTPRIVLVIGASIAGLFGILLLAAPAAMLQGFGFAGQPEGIVLSRDVGVMLLGLALIDFLGRNATGSTLRALLLGNLTVQVLEFLVNGIEMALGQVPMAAASGLVIHLLLGVLFISALRRPER